MLKHLYITVTSSAAFVDSGGTASVTLLPSFRESLNASFSFSQQKGISFLGLALEPKDAAAWLQFIFFAGAATTSCPAATNGTATDSLLMLPAFLLMLMLLLLVAVMDRAMAAARAVVLSVAPVLGLGVVFVYFELFMLLVFMLLLLLLLVSPSLLAKPSLGLTDAGPAFSGGKLVGVKGRNVFASAPPTSLPFSLMSGLEREAIFKI